MKLVAEDGRLRVVYSVSYGPMGAAAARQQMDANHDGRLTAAETRAGAQEFGARLAREARLTVDGDRATLRWDAPFVGPPSGPVDTSPLTIELSSTVPLPGGESIVRLVDVPTLENVERSDYGFEARPPAELLASGAGDAPSAQEKLVSFLDRRARGPRVVSARVRLPAAPAGVVRMVAAAAVALLLAGVGGWLVRRRISARRTGT